MVKNLPANAGDMGLSPGLGRSLIFGKTNSKAPKVQRIKIVLCALASVMYATYKLVCALQYVNYIL